MKCKNCGHKEKSHHKKLKMCNHISKEGLCDCKKFVAEDEILIPTVFLDKPKVIRSKGSASIIRRKGRATFNLSNEIWDKDDPYNTHLLVKDVKEFIRLEDDLINQYALKMITWEELCSGREKLAGKELS